MLRNGSLVTAAEVKHLCESANGQFEGQASLKEVRD